MSINEVPVMFRDEAKDLTNMSLLERVAEVSYQTDMVKFLMEDDQRMREEWLKRHAQQS